MKNNSYIKGKYTFIGFNFSLVAKSKSSLFHFVHAHAARRAEPPKPAALEFLLGNSEVIIFLGMSCYHIFTHLHHELLLAKL
jgi:hypothetical protein